MTSRHVMKKLGFKTSSFTGEKVRRRREGKGR
jgi:hypothetical protein